MNFHYMTKNQAVSLVHMALVGMVDMGLKLLSKKGDHMLEVYWVVWYLEVHEVG